MFWTGQTDFNLAPFPSLASFSPVRAVEARRIARYLSASDFIAGTLAISAMGVLRDASENLMKMLRTSPDFILHWMILDDWSPVTSIYDYYDFYFFLIFVIFCLSICHIVYIVSLVPCASTCAHLRWRQAWLTLSLSMHWYLLSLSLCINIYNNICIYINYT